MSCVLRVWGEAFDTAKFLATSPLDPDTVYEKDVEISPVRPTRRMSGFNLTVSDIDSDNLEGHILEAIRFLDEYEDELRRLGGFPGVEWISLHFGVQWRDEATQTKTFPSDLLWRAGALDIWLQVTHYATVETIN
jgi:hypothetical protein